MQSMRHATCDDSDHTVSSLQLVGHHIARHILDSLCSEECLVFLLERDVLFKFFERLLLAAVCFSTVRCLLPLAGFEGVPILRLLSLAASLVSLRTVNM
jgi:hypothetical protein